jgi:hypothetical protein
MVDHPELPTLRVKTEKEKLGQCSSKSDVNTGGRSGLRHYDCRYQNSGGRVLQRIYQNQIENDNEVLTATDESALFPCRTDFLNSTTAAPRRRSSRRGAVAVYVGMISI